MQQESILLYILRTHGSSNMGDGGNIVKDVASAMVSLPSLPVQDPSIASGTVALAVEFHWMISSP
jgi:hypothetical protein